MLITFSGLDGSGKSTLIAWLKAELERRNRPVTVLHMADDVGVYACLRSGRERLKRLAGRGNGAAPERPRWAGPAPASGLRGLARKGRDAILWSKSLRRALYPVDLAIFLAIRLFVEKVRRRILVTDRYFYDTLVDVAIDERGGGSGGDAGGPSLWVRLLERLTPVPDVPVFLDVSPEESYARKAEYSVAYLARRSASYRAVAHLVPSALVLANTDLATTQRALERAVRDRLRS